MLVKGIIGDRVQVVSVLLGYVLELVEWIRNYFLRNLSPGESSGYDTD